MSLDIHALSGAYAVDALDPEERQEFERHLAGCASCRAEVASLQDAAAELAELSRTAPPPSLRASILQEVSRIDPLPSRGHPTDRRDLGAPTETGTARHTAAGEPTGPAQTRPTGVTDLGRHREARRGSWRWLAAAAAALVLVVGGLTWHPWSPSTSQGQLTATEQVLRAGDAQRFVQQVDGATATIVRSVNLGRSVVIAEGMAPPPDGKVYELWYFDSTGKPVRAGLMPDHGDRVTVLLEGDAATAQGAGITVEPAGGSDQPTSKPIVHVTFA